MSVFDREIINFTDGEMDVVGLLLFVKNVDCYGHILLFTDNTLYPNWWSFNLCNYAFLFLAA